MICVDASVFVASARKSEAGHAASNAFFKQVKTFGEEVCCPVLVLPGCAAALARRTDSAEKGAHLVDFVQGFPGIRFIALSFQLAERAAQIAAHYRLSGADAVYVATAERQDATLVTWDTEMLERGTAVVSTLMPTEWLEEQQAG